MALDDRPFYRAFLLSSVKSRQLRDAFRKITLRNNRIASVHALRLVTGQLHGDGARNTGAFQVPDRSSSEIMWNPAWDSRFLDRVVPGLSETPYRFPVTVKHPGNDLIGGLLHSVSPGSLPLKQGLHGRKDGKWKRPAFVRLRCAGLQPDDAGVEINLPPPQSKNLLLPPTSQVHEFRNGFHLLGEMFEDCPEFRLLEKSGSCIPDLESR